MPWINHPATQDDGPVSIWRWLKYHIGMWLGRKGENMVDDALYPDRCMECGAPIKRDCECDHIPF